MPESAPVKILIRTPNWLGDMVMSSGFVRAVLEAFPESQVDLIVKSGFEKIPLPQRGQIIPFDPKKETAGNFGRTLRAENYDYFYVLPPSFSAAWMAHKSKIPHRIGYSGEFRSFLLSLAKKPEATPRSQHLLKEYLNLLAPGLSTEKYPPRLEITHEWVEKQLGSLEISLPESFFVFTPGAIFGPAKQWPLEHFRTLATLLHNVFGDPILILGTEADVKSGAEISLGLDFVQNYCGQTSLSELLAILAKAKLLVGNDSGSMHLMSALQRPQIAIFGSTSPDWTAPINPNATVLSRNLSCSPCFSRTCRFAHYDCLKRIEPELVLEEILKLLTEKNQTEA